MERSPTLWASGRWADVERDGPGRIIELREEYGAWMSSHEQNLTRTDLVLAMFIVLLH
jgi:hypothetical protein